MKHSVNLEWKGNMAFQTDMDGHTIVIDAPENVGGNDLGPRPKKFMLTALAGCTGMDVVSILKKMRVTYKSLNIIVEADLSADQPVHYTAMKIIYEFAGNNLPFDKLEKAVRLSEEKYCGVSAVYRKVMEMSTEIRIKEEEK